MEDNSDRFDLSDVPGIDMANCCVTGRHYVFYDVDLDKWLLVLDPGVSIEVFYCPFCGKEMDKE